MFKGLVVQQGWTGQPVPFVKNLEMKQTTTPIPLWDNNSENPSPQFYKVHRIFQEHTTSHDSDHSNYCGGITKILKCGLYQACRHNI
jgi:hypothetical protein